MTDIKQWERIPKTSEEMMDALPSLDDFRTTCRVLWWMSRCAQFLPDEFSQRITEDHLFAIVANNIPSEQEEIDYYIDALAIAPALPPVQRDED